MYTYICLVIFMCFVLSCVLCGFMVGCGSSNPIEDIVRFRYGGLKVTYPFTHIFVKFFQFSYIFSSLWRLLCLFFIDFRSLIACLCITRIYMIGQLSMV